MDGLLFTVTVFLLSAVVWVNSLPDVISKGRIVAGNLVFTPSFPYMACLLGYSLENGYRTGAGVIISSSYILSAAHFTSK